MKQATNLLVAFLLGIFFSLENGGDMLLRNAGCNSADYTALHHKDGTSLSLFICPSVGMEELDSSRMNFYYTCHGEGILKFILFRVLLKTGHSNRYLPRSRTYDPA
jgi:hypothetical protein